MSWYTTGSVNLTNNSKTVTGVGTKWANPLIGICAGQMLILKTTDTIEICEIASVQSDTQLTLANKYAGVTKTGVNYEIPTAPNVSVEHLALRISEMLNYYQQQMEGWQTVLTGEGEVTLTAPDGRIVTIKSQYSIQDELIKLVEKGKNFSEIAIKNAELSNNASQSAKNSESSAKTSTNNAAKFADSASQSAKNAGNSATSAKTAETGAQTSATEAKQSALDAKNWASTVDTTTFVKKSGDTIPDNLTIKKNDAKISIINEDNCGLILHAQSRTNNLLFLFVNDGKSDYKMAYNQGRNSIEFRALDDVKINGKSALKAGDGGLLSYTQTIKDVFAPEITTGFYRFDINSINTPSKGLGYINKISWNANESRVMAYEYNSLRAFTGVKNKNTGEVKYAELITTVNSTVDSNGFYKKASPILRLYGTENIELIAGFTIAGCGLVNDLATGVIATRIDVGHYEIRGSLGFAREGWYIQLPEDANGNKKFFADYSADENGIITIKTYTKKFNTESCEIVAGDPIDITDGRWIDVRLEMPVIEEVESSIDDPSSLECSDNRSTNEIL